MKITDYHYIESLNNLHDVLNRLGKALSVPADTDRYIIDASIHRFKFCIELFWKNFKNFAALEGKEALSPKQAIAIAYQMKWFDAEELWLNMLHDRNQTSHTYKKIKADEIYQHIKIYYPEMRKTYERLETIYSKGQG